MPKSCKGCAHLFGGHCYKHQEDVEERIYDDCFEAEEGFCDTCGELLIETSEVVEHFGFRSIERYKYCPSCN